MLISMGLDIEWNGWSGSTRKWGFEDINLTYVKVDFRFCWSYAKVEMIENLKLIIDGRKSETNVWKIESGSVIESGSWLKVMVNGLGWKWIFDWGLTFGFWYLGITYR